MVQAQLIRCAEIDAAKLPVADLTTVADAHGPRSVVAADATGITAPAVAAFTANIVNNGPINKSGSGDVVGITADFEGGDVSIVNTASGSIYAESVDGLADGIFANGDVVTVNNRGTIQADGYDWAAGIEAQGGSVTVNNNGTISASASAYDTAYGVYGHAYGIYVAGSGDDGTVVNNRGSIEASGPYATGIYAYDGGSGGINVTNRGDITATAAGGFATGNFLGLRIEQKLALGQVVVRVITVDSADNLVERLKGRGYRLTCVDARGTRGKVNLLFMIVKRKKLQHVLDIIRNFNPQAFYSVEDVRSVADVEVPQSEQRQKSLRRLFPLRKGK